MYKPAGVLLALIVLRSQGTYHQNSQKHSEGPPFRSAVGHVTIVNLNV